MINNRPHAHQASSAAIGMQLRDTKWRACIIFVIVLAIGNAQRSTLADALEDRLVKDGVLAWRELAKTSTGEYGEFAESRRISYGGDKPERVKSSRTVFKRAGGLLLEEQRTLSTDGVTGATAVAAVGEDYSFTLSRRQGDPFVITYIGANRAESLRKQVTRSAFFYADVAWRLYHWPLDELVTSPAFTMQRIEVVERSNVSCVRFTFTLGEQTDVEDKARKLLREGSITVDPTRQWCIREYDILIRTGREGGRAQGFINYHDQPVAPPIPARLNEDFTNLSRQGSVHTDVKFESFVYQRPSSKQFSIGAYGFPDDKAFRVKRLNRMAVLGSILGFFGLLAALRMRRRLHGRQRVDGE